MIIKVSDVNVILNMYKSKIYSKYIWKTLKATEKIKQKIF